MKLLLETKYDLPNVAAVLYGLAAAIQLPRITRASDSLAKGCNAGKFEDGDIIA